nr:hypothetical protein [uncultured Sphaerochaeta sp.]
MRNLIIGIVLFLVNVAIGISYLFDSSVLMAVMQFAIGIFVLVASVEAYVVTHPYVPTTPTHFVNFYGLKCFAKISGLSIELIGINRVTNWLLGIYALLITCTISAVSFVLSIFRIDYDTNFHIKVLGVREEHEID